MILKKVYKNIRYSLTSLCLLTLLSCNSSFLEEPIDNRTLITTLDEIESVLPGIMPRADLLFTDIMTDDYNFKETGNLVASATSRIAPIFTLEITKQSFSETKFLNDFNPNRSWVRYYYRINNAWLVLNRLDNYNSTATNPDDTQDAKIKSIKGQALAIKAYSNFALVNLFAKQYDPAMAATDIGIPFVDYYSTQSIEVFPTKTIADIYKAIEIDLLEAANLLDENKNPLENVKFHFTIHSVNALLCRLYLYKKDWDKCIKYANKVLAENTSLLDIKELYDTHGPFGDNQSYTYSKSYFSPDNKSYLLMSAKTYQLLAYFWHGFYPYSLNAFMNDNGYDPYFIQTSQLFRDIIPQKYIYFFDRSKRSMHLPLLTTDETLYNRAEAYLQKGENAKAKTDLDLLLDKDQYMDVAAKKAELASINDKAPLLKFLLGSKRMRFFAEGMRWFDIKRYQLPISHEFKGTTYEIKGDNPEDYVIRIPLEELDLRK